MIARLKPRLIIASVFIGAAALCGCMPAQLHEAVPWSIRECRTTDAKSQPVTGMPFLRVDAYLIDRLSSAAVQDSRDRSRILNLIGQCHQLADRSAASEIDRLPAGQIDRIWRTCFGTEPEPRDSRAELCRRYVDGLDRQYVRFLDAMKRDTAPDAPSREAARICQNAQPSITAHRGGGAMLAAVSSAHASDPMHGRAAGAPLRAYDPGRLAEPIAAALDENPDRALLERCAPIIAQEIAPGSHYSEQCDEIGSVHLEGNARQIRVSIRTQSPAVYAYSRRAVIHNREFLQLLYCYWFPEHPPARPGDPEAGPIDGATLRITVDGQCRPLFIEATQNCGCHYRCFAARWLDQASRRQFGPPADDSLSALTRRHASIELLAVDLFDAPANGSTHPIIFSPAGAHVPVGVSFDSSTFTDRHIVERRPYALHPYELLENMPTDFGRASMFGADGLVHGAGRTEGWLLAPTGMLSAGQPRQRGTQLICWDKQAFDDPHLLEKTFQLPDSL